MLQRFLIIYFTIFVNNNTHSVIIKVPKSRMPTNKSIEKFRKKSSLKLENGNHKSELSNVLVQRFTFQHKEILPVKDLKKAEILLPFKLYSKKQNSDRFKYQLGINVCKKYKNISKELEKRLHVNDPIRDIFAVTDIDTEFYRCIDGRPLQFNIPIFKSLKESENKLLHIKQEIGTKKDYPLNIEVNYRNEIRIFDIAVKSLTNQVKCFDTFISEDYQKSMTLLAKCDKLRSQVDLQASELQNVAIEKFTIMSKLIGLEYKYGFQLKYGRFLYYLSPPGWRLNNRDFARSCEIEAKGFDFGNSNEEDTFAVIYERLRNICYGYPIKPALYFINSKDLMDIFDAMETQQLYYYTHVNHLAPYTKILKTGIKSLKEIIIQDSALVMSSVKRFERLLLFSEQRCALLEEKFLKILYGLFYKTIAATDVLKLTLHLQFCYERVFSVKPLNMDIGAMAKSLEKFYMDYSKKLDFIKSDAIRCAMTRCMDMELLKIKRANNAATELRLFYRLERELLRAHGFLVGNRYTPIKKTCLEKNDKAVVSKDNVKERKRKSLTEAEFEYLKLFTDWTENEDPATFLQSLNLKDNNKDDNVDVK